MNVSVSNKLAHELSKYPHLHKCFTATSRQLLRQCVHFTWNQLRKISNKGKLHLRWSTKSNNFPQINKKVAEFYSTTKIWTREFWKFDKKKILEIWFNRQTKTKCANKNRFPTIITIQNWSQTKNCNCIPV